MLVNMDGDLLVLCASCDAGKSRKVYKEPRPLCIIKIHQKICESSVEGLNNKAKLTMRKAYGFRTYKAIEIALYHTLGELPEPEFTLRILLRKRF